MANLTGSLKGKKGRSGRCGYGIEKKIGKFKDLAWDFILEECKDRTKLAEYVKLFSSRLMPQMMDVTSGGEKLVTASELILSMHKNESQRTTENSGTVSKLG